MRVAVFTDTYLPEINGVTKTFGRMARHFEEKGVPYRFFCPSYATAPANGGNGKNGHGANGSALLDGIDSIRRARSVAFPLYPECRVAFPSRRRWRDEIREFAPDIVHVATPFPVGVAGLRIAKKLKLPVVASYHTNFDAYMASYRVGFLKGVYWPYFRWFHNQCASNFAPSTATIRDIERSGVKNVRRWARGVEADLFTPERRDESLRDALGWSGKKAILYVGRLGAEKSVHLLVDAVKKLNERRGADGHLLALVGDGPARAKLMAQAPDNAMFLGFKRGEELWRLFASADLFAFPSATETLGNVALEAMASGLPTVAANAGGIPDNIVHEETGLLHAPGDANALAIQLERLLDDDELARRLAANARRRAEESTWEKIFDRLLEDYEEALLRHAVEH